MRGNGRRASGLSSLGCWRRRQSSSVTGSEGAERAVDEGGHASDERNGATAARGRGRDMKEGAASCRWRSRLAWTALFWQAYAAHRADFLFAADAPSRSLRRSRRSASGARTAAATAAARRTRAGEARKRRGATAGARTGCGERRERAWRAGPWGGGPFIGAGAARGASPGRGVHATPFACHAAEPH